MFDMYMDTALLSKYHMIRIICLKCDGYSFYGDEFTEHCPSCKGRGEYFYSVDINKEIELLISYIETHLDSIPFYRDMPLQVKFEHLDEQTLSSFKEYLVTERNNSTNHKKRNHALSLLLEEISPVDLEQIILRERKGIIVDSLESLKCLINALNTNEGFVTHTFELSNVSKKERTLIVDYLIQYRKENGKYYYIVSELLEQLAPRRLKEIEEEEELSYINLLINEYKYYIENNSFSSHFRQKCNEQKEINFHKMLFDAVYLISIEFYKDSKNDFEKSN